MRDLALEFVTDGLAGATSHRVLSPKGTSPRYSVPFFQSIGMDIRLPDERLKCKYPYPFDEISIPHPLSKVPPEIEKLREERGLVSATDCEFV